MRATTIAATLAAIALGAAAHAQSITLTRTPSGTVRVGDTITVTVSVAPGAQPIRGGGAEITFPTATFELLDAPAAGGNAAAAVVRDGASPYTGTVPPPWFTPGTQATLQLPIVRPEATLATLDSYSGPVATFRLRAKAQATIAAVNVTSTSRLVPGGTTTGSGFAIPVEAGATLPAAGDVSCPINGRIDSNDAVAILRFEVDGDPWGCFTQACDITPDCWFPGAADVNGDGKCDGMDAIRILEAYADPGIVLTAGADKECPCPPLREEAPDPGAPIRHTLTIADADALAGGEVTLSAFVDSPHAVEAFRAGLAFDPAVFAFVEESAEGAGGLLVANGEAAENVRVAGVRTGSAAMQPLLVTVRLRVAQDAPEGTHAIGFLDGFTRVNGDAQGIDFVPGTVTVRRGAGLPEWREIAR